MLINGVRWKRDIGVMLVPSRTVDRRLLAWQFLYYRLVGKIGYTFVSVDLDDWLWWEWYYRQYWDKR